MKIIKLSSNITVYHGTTSDFSNFSSSYTRSQMGIHFGTLSQAKAVVKEAYENAEPFRIIEAKINISNPLLLNDLGSWYGENVVKMVNKKIGTNLHPSSSDDTIRNAIKKKGYDSVVYENQFEGDGLSYIVFDESNISYALSRLSMLGWIGFEKSGSTVILDLIREHGV